jgi:hypothetical protein
MSEQAEKQAKVDIEKDIIRHDPVALNTAAGAIAVFGGEHVGKTVLGAVEFALSNGAFETMDHRVRSIVFRTDGRPRLRLDLALGLADLDSYSMSINLMQVFSDSLEEVMNNESERTMSVVAVYHQMLLSTILHEAFHISLMADDVKERDKYDDALYGTMPADKANPYLEQVENDADEEARDMMLYVAKAINIEPILDEATFLNAQLQELLAGDESEFALQQKHMIEKGIFMHVPASQEGDIVYKELNIRSFKDFMRNQADPECCDAAWDKPTIGTAGERYDLATQMAPKVDTQAEIVEAVEPEVVGGFPTDVPFDPDTVPPEAAVAMAMEQEVDYDDWDETAEEEVVAETPPQQPTLVMPETQSIPSATQSSKPAPGFTTPTAPLAVNTVPDHGLSDEDVAKIVFGVYNKCYNHIFTRCGWPSFFGDADYNDGVLDANGHPVNPLRNSENVWREPLQLNELERAVVVRSECKVPNEEGKGIWQGQTGRATGDGLLYGQTALHKKLPLYVLHINMGGSLVKRKLIPQNPNTGAASAKRALAGNSIMWVMEGDDNIIESGGDKYLWICENSKWTQCKSRTPQAS